MHIRFVLKNVLAYMYRRKLNFVLTMIISVVTIYLLATVLTLAGEAYYHIYAVKNTIRNTEYLNINVLMDSADMDYCKRVETFDKEMQETFQNQYGKFMFVTTNLQNEATGLEESIKVLYIDSSLTDLCNVSPNFGDGKLAEDGSIVRACVGVSLADKYPVGTILKNMNTGSEIQITGILEQNQTWVPDLLFHTNEAVVSLDEYMIAEMDTSFFDASTDFYANTFNSFYIKSETEEDSRYVKNRVKEIAGQNNILYYANTVNELILQEQSENKKLFHAVGNLTIFVVLIAMLAFVSASFSDIYSRHSEFGIMYINGVSSLDIYFMIWIENLIKFVIAFVILIYVYTRGLDEGGMYVFKTMIMPILITAVMLFSIILSYILLLTIRKRNILFLLGGAKL